jgi:hypothetical protein
MSTLAIGSPSMGQKETSSPPEGALIHSPANTPELTSLIPNSFKISFADLMVYSFRSSPD